MTAVLPTVGQTITFNGPAGTTLTGVVDAQVKIGPSVLNTHVHCHITAGNVDAYVPTVSVLTAV